MRHADGRKYKRKHIVQDAFENALGSNRATRAKSEAFLKHVDYRPHQEDRPLAGEGIIAQARGDLTDTDYLEGAVREILLDRMPDLHLPRGWYFRIQPVDARSFRVATNLDFKALNSDPRSGNAISEAHLALAVLDARADLNFAAGYMSEIITDNARSKIIQLRFGQLLERRLKSSEAINSFQDVHLTNAKAIREAINSGERSFDDFLKLLDRADRFMNWLKGINPDAKLLEEYYEAVTKETWANRLPGKSSRFVICTIAGLLLDALHAGPPGIALGVGIGAIDTLWLDKILNGWRPNQFVSGPLKRFVDN